MKKVLIVEDEPSLLFVYRRCLSKRVNLIVIDNLKDAETFFSKNPELDIITMDGNIIGGTTIALVRKIRETYKGPIVASSASPDLQKALLSAGCDYIASKEKLHEKIIELLVLSI